MERYWEIIQVALEAVFANRSRSILTALGIIFGVAAVIAMMAIGNGARQEILEQMKMVGVNNIIITAKQDKSKKSDDGDEGKTERKQFSPGLTLLDAKSIQEIIPTVAKVSPEVNYETSIIKGGISQEAKLHGVTPDFFEVFGLQLESGTMFNNDQLESGSPVCIIGPSIKTRFFSLEDPIGKQIKCGNIWLRVIGVLEKRLTADPDMKDIGVSDFNNDIYAPIQTVLIRYKDRALVNAANVSGSGSTTVIVSGGGGVVAAFGGDVGGDDEQNYHQLDKIVVQVEESSQLTATTKVLSQMLRRRHMGVEDFEISVPELLLKQEQRTKDIFNIVLGAIAGISLLVGGIGIMNIMLASVMERIREIGVRRSIGARKSDIIFQFLSEATLISISGGIFGVILGVVMARIITETTDILTIVSGTSILISFGVAATVGIVFGYLPARKAAEQDPVESLRHD